MTTISAPQSPSPSWTSAALQFRVVNILEGLSYLVLVFFAMPMKYLAADPTWVTLFGRIHGGLFVLFALALARVFFGDRWPLQRAVVAFVASLVPGGAFFIERMVAKAEAKKAAAHAA